MRILSDIKYSDTNQLLDLHLPENNEFDVFVYFHGGGLEAGDKDGHIFVSELVQNGIAVVNANYRLYPNAAFPEFIDDAAAAVAWTKNNIEKYGKMKRLFVGGSSAGGYLTQMLCFDKKYLAFYGIDADSIDGYFMDAGQPTSHFNVLREKGLDSRRIVVDETAPLYFVNKKRNFPYIKIVVSDNDLTNRLEQTQLLFSTLKHFGNDMNKISFEVIENSNHCEYVNKCDQDGKSVFSKMICDFIEWCD